LGKGARINLNKKSVGLSLGVRGARIGIGRRGLYTSAGIPGTGLYAINYSGKAVAGRKGHNTVSQGNSVGFVSTLKVLAIIACIFLVIMNPILIIIFLIIGVIYFSSTGERIKRKLKQASQLFDQQKYEQALPILKEVETLDPKSSRMWFLMGGAYHNTGKFEETIEYLKKYNDATPNDYNSQLALADAYYRTKQYPSAIAILQHIPDTFTQRLKVIQLLGGCFFADGKNDLAIEEFKKAPLLKRMLDADLMEVHYNLAFIYEKSGDKNNALKHYKKVYAQDIGYSDVAKRITDLEKA